MAWRVSDSFLQGYFNNPSPKSTFGMLLFEGLEGPIYFELTGDPGESLRGRSFEFHRSPTAPPATPLRDGFATAQKGVVGEMELRMAKVPIGDFMAAIEQGNEIAFEWKPLLHLEWSSRNGRVVLELVDPVFVLDKGEPFPELAIPSDAEGGFSITEVHLTEDDGIPEVRTFLPAESVDPSEPEDLASYLDRLNREKELGMYGEEEDPDLGEWIERREDEDFIASMLSPRRLPSPEDVDEAQAQSLVMTLLAELALVNIAVHLCPHCTYRDAYRFIVEELLPEERAPAKLAGSGWTMNFSYRESCPICIAEVEEDYRDLKPRSLQPEDEADESGN